VGEAGEQPTVLAKRFVASIRSLKRDLGIPDYLDALREEHIPELAEAACWEADTSYPVPRYMSVDTCAKLLRGLLPPEAARARGAGIGRPAVERGAGAPRRRAAIGRPAAGTPAAIAKPTGGRGASAKKSAAGRQGSTNRSPRTVRKRASSEAARSAPPASAARLRRRAA
jgi:hypothetical protein